MTRRGFAMALMTVAFACAGRADHRAPAPATGESEPTAPAADIDYLAVGPRAFLDTAAPLLAFRGEQGHGVLTLAVEDIERERAAETSSADAIRARIAAVAAEHPTLRFVLLVGDPAGGPALVPAFPRTTLWGEPYYTDYPYSLPEREHPLAVGRIPARDAAQLTAVVGKLIDYERAPNTGAWQRRVNVFAGPAKFGPLIDAIIERTATVILDRVPYEFDLGVTFAKEDSPWVYAFDHLTDKIAADMKSGSLVTVYTGHGLPRKLDSVVWRGEEYSIGDTERLASVHIDRGRPFFISLTCLTGAYGLAGGERSLAESLALNPDGPVAVFAASASSHPVANIVLGHGFLDHLFRERIATVGEVVAATKADLLHPEEPLFEVAMNGEPPEVWQQNVLMYNLFGDPATRLRYPGNATVEPGPATAGGRVEVAVSAAGIGDGEVTVTLERPRTVMPDDMVPLRTLRSLDRDHALAAMRDNHARVNDRVLARARGRLERGATTVEVDVPAHAGRFAVKALVEGPAGVAVGQAWIEATGP